ncbi:MAG: hypothetical protein WBG30_06335 [Psychrilyobacter sp.]|uniref:hypothetical protein n=1 Tax=Psychrilyobacter sp. TaxID=2586924 RepID=UPI003C7919A3
MKKIILIIIMLNLFTVCLSKGIKEDEKISMIVKSLEQKVELMEKKVTATKIILEERQYKNKIVAEDMALLEENDISLKKKLDAFQIELETLEESIKKK